MSTHVKSGHDSIGKQLDKIENKIEDVNNTNQDIQKEKPLLNLPEYRQSLGLPNKDLEITKQIDKIFSKINIGTNGTKELTVINKEDNNSDTDSIIQELEQQFNKISFNKPNPTSLTKNWYSKPTPPDLQYEERNLSNQFSVSSNKMYEWNIDGLSEHELLNKLNHMSMVANSYLNAFESLGQSDIVELLASGFTGILRS